MIQLSNIAPDWASLRAQLMTAADGFPGTWQDRITSSMGQTIVDMVAAIGAYSQYSIESSYQEVWPMSAKNAEALYAASNFAGVRTNRRTPARLPVTLTAPSAMTIPPYTQFVGAGASWFNRDALTLSTTPTPVNLYQGLIQVRSMYGLGTDFQAFVTEEAAFQVSNTDVLLKIDNVSIPVQIEGLWTAKDEPAVQQFTLPDGKAIVLFGNDLYGSKPGTNNLCEFTYVVTLGLNGNNIITSGQTITMSGNPDVTGIPTGNPIAGANESDYNIYKNVTPALFGEFDSSVTANQYKKKPLQYPGVIDARVLAQREINPKALTWMNSMKVCLLTTTPWGDPEWDAFRDWFNKNTMYSTQFYREDPVPVLIDLRARISCKNYSNLTAVKANVEAAIDKLFELRQGSIGLDLYLSDILATMRDADSNVEYIEMSSPSVDIVLSGLSVGYPTLVASAGGTLPIGTYDYGIGLTSTLGGMAAPARWRSITTTVPNQKITVTWPMAANPAMYMVYGRTTPSAMGLIAPVAPNGQPFQSFVDDGSIVPTGTVPQQSTIASYYPKLNSKSLNMVYTNRNLR
jgi:hypothetical protein